jgi:hypothetical protein
MFLWNAPAGSADTGGSGRRCQRGSLQTMGCSDNGEGKVLVPFPEAAKLPRS